MDLVSIYEHILTSYNIQTPALMFPTISLLLLAYTNRFLAITSVIRKLHEDMEQNPQKKDFYYPQIKSLHSRIELIVTSQKIGTISILLCILSMFLIFINLFLSLSVFILAIVLMGLSLIYTLKELSISKEALTFILEDCEKNI